MMRALMPSDSDKLRAATCQRDKVLFVNRVTNSSITSLGHKNLIPQDFGITFYIKKAKAEVSLVGCLITSRRQCSSPPHCKKGHIASTPRVN